MQKIKYLESIITIFTIPLIITFNNHVLPLNNNSISIYILINIILVLILASRIFYCNNIYIIKNIFLYGYSVSISLSFSAYTIESGPFLLALLISIIGGAILSLSLSILIVVLKKVVLKKIN